MATERRVDPRSPESRANLEGVVVTVDGADIGFL
jgi:hypothetical protein